MNWSKEAETHFNEHLKDFSWPAKGSDVVTVCNNATDLSEDERKRFVEAIDPEKTYENLDELKGDLSRAPELAGQWK